MLSLLLLASPSDGALIRVQTPAPADAAAVHELGLDVWTEAPRGPWLDVRVRPGEQALLDLTGLDYVVRDPDLGVQAQHERLRLSGPVVHGGLPQDAVSMPPLSLSPPFPPKKSEEKFKKNMRKKSGV